MQGVPLFVTNKLIQQTKTKVQTNSMAFIKDLSFRLQSLHNKDIIMKIEVNTIIPKTEEIKRTYPYIGMHQQTYLIVGFYAPKSGIALDKGDTIHKLFVPCDIWVEEYFTPIDCSITLTQKI